MCGIAGWAGSKKSFKNTLADKTKVINKILDFQNHRGPDARGIWAKNGNPIVLGHNRLSIIELSEAGAQPMQSADGRWVISYNGELYNYQSLRKNLEEKYGVIFKGNSDTEVFLHGFINYGVDEFLRLADGMFAAAIYDLTDEVLFLVRDRVGEKPLFYSFDDDNIYFASELKALVCSAPVDLQVDPAGLQLYMLLRYVPAPHTILKNVYKLKPGCYIRYRCGKVLQQIPYFSWDPGASEVPVNNANYNEVVRGTEALWLNLLKRE